MKTRLSATAWLLVVVLMLTLAPGSRASGGSEILDKPVRLRVTSRFSPIGSIVGNHTLVAAALIDGRVASGEQPLWGGELIQAPANSPVSVSFESTGEVALARGAAARFGVAQGEAGSRVLVTSLLNGSLNFKLRPEAGAYVEAAGSGFTASAGSRFVIDLIDSRPSVEVLSGTVDAQTPGGQRYILRPPPGQGGTISVAARATRQVQIQVTDENDRPVPDLAIVFSLGDPCLGSLGLGVGAGTTFTEKTDSRGIATVPWVAGAVACTATIVARVEGTSFEYTYRVEVKSKSFWTTQNSLIVAAIAAGATIGILFATGVFGGDDDPIVPVPPPRVNP